MMEFPQPCPYLPPYEAWRTAASMGRFRREERGAAFYHAALATAQSRWCCGLPAQAILQLNRAWSADLAADEAVLRAWPSPYRALGWMLARAASGGFLGNPVRHFQHLATRMHGVRRAPRVWRAWACFHLAEALLDGEAFPRDLEQARRERLEFPEITAVEDRLASTGWTGELAEFRGAMGRS